MISREEKLDSKTGEHDNNIQTSITSKEKKLGITATSALILSYLPVSDIHKFQIICQSLQATFLEIEKLIIGNLRSNLISLQTPLRRVVFERLFHRNFHPKNLNSLPFDSKELTIVEANKAITQPSDRDLLYTLLNKNKIERIEALEKIFSLAIDNRINELTNTFSSDAAIVALIFGLLSYEQILFNLNFANPYIVQGLHEKLFTYDCLRTHKNSGSTTGTRDNIRYLFDSSRGLYALRKGLITMADTPYFTELYTMLKIEFIALLEKQLISSKLILKMCKSIDSSLHWLQLIKSTVIKAIESELIIFRNFDPEKQRDVTQAVQIFNNLEVLVSSIGQRCLKKGLTMTQISNLYYALDTFISKNGAVALEENLIPVDEFDQITDPKALLSENGLVALREGLLSWSQAKTISLPIILSKNGLRALGGNYIKIEKINNKDSEILDSMLSDFGITALTEDLINYEIAKLIHRSRGSYMPDKLKHLLSEQGIDLLRKKLITAEDAVDIQNLQEITNGNGLVAIREGWITAKLIARIGKCFSPNTLSFVPVTISHLVSDVAMKALRGGVFSYKELFESTDGYELCGLYNNIAHILTPNGLAILRLKLLSFKEMITIENIKTLITDEGVNALKIGIVKPVEFRRNGPLSYMQPQDFKKYYKEKLSILNNAALKIQTMWRTHHKNKRSNDVSSESLNITKKII